MRNRATGSRHGFQSAQGSPDDSRHTGKLIFHLDELAAQLGNSRANISAISVEGVIG